MRNLTKVAIASVLVAGAWGVLHNTGGNSAFGADDRAEHHFIRQGADQTDQNLKLLFAVKLYSAGANETDRKGDQQGRADTTDTRPSS